MSDTPSLSQSAPAQLSPGLANLARLHPGRQVEVIVQLKGDPLAVRAAIDLDGGRVVRQLPIINGFAAVLRAGSVTQLATLSDVRVISLNAPIQSQSLANTSTSNLATSYLSSIHAPQAWSQGATGSGVGVAVIDTGIAGNLPDFQVSPSNTASRVVASAVVNPAAPNANDTYGHGTHISGLIAGDGWNRTGDPAAGKYIGVAPDANLIEIKADDGGGHVTELDLIDGIGFAISHQQQFNIRVINLSVRATVAQSYKTDALDAAVEAAWLHGIVVVVAAGNLGTAPDAVSYAPANDPFVITVGAVDDQGTPGTGDDALASWSSRGLTQDGVVKPDVLAPGAHLVSTLSPGSQFASLCPTCVTDGNYFKAGGTSEAAGVASGAVADILSVHPDWTPNQVKAALITRSRPAAKSNSTDLVNADGVSLLGVTDTSTVKSGEISIDKVLNVGGGTAPAPANLGLTTNQFVDPATGNIVDQTGSWATGSWGTGSWGTGSWGTGSWGTGSWGTGSWSSAPAQWTAAWAPSDSYTGAPLNPAGFTPVPPDCIQLQRGFFSTGSWGTGSWSSADLSNAIGACQQASAQTGSWGTGSWGTGSWGTGSWGTGSWGTGSWGTGSWGTGSWGTGSWGTGSWGTGSWATSFDK